MCGCLLSSDLCVFFFMLSSVRSKFLWPFFTNVEFFNILGGFLIITPPPPVLEFHGDNKLTFQIVAGFRPYEAMIIHHEREHVLNCHSFAIGQSLKSGTSFFISVNPLDSRPCSVQSFSVVK